MITQHSIDLVVAEAENAHAKHGLKSIFYGSLDRQYVILAEEVGEVAKAINDAHLDTSIDSWNRLCDEMKKELIQVAAMALTIFESLRRSES